MGRSLGACLTQDAWAHAHAGQGHGAPTRACFRVPALPLWCGMPQWSSHLPQGAMEAEAAEAPAAVEAATDAGLVRTLYMRVCGAGLSGDGRLACRVRHRSPHPTGRPIRRREPWRRKRLRRWLMPAWCGLCTCVYTVLACVGMVGWLAGSDTCHLAPTSCREPRRRRQLRRWLRPALCGLFACMRRCWLE
jgi:hypothetical protein